ncbi:branched-chain amino acid ABC transporter permease [Desulfovibrio sp. An276]|uniref:high-affinity branched-chain amino acid ABC transporter permease LivM n=1 Tax=Desulfovibrio sp. An276 TaxID=1965618 RepID=UPI000B3789AD|nr:high-affinity branched-chain amino acid ABC transporter permease LivM [Desulfovibrio sp. An276]OUO52676.1 branched-chain amino acid ABC transporter permease [Desulfovibrio sp. An276]
MKRILHALLAAVWFMVLCSPIMGLQIQPDKSVIFLWERLAALGVGIFFASLLWQWYFASQRSSFSLKMPAAVTSVAALLKEPKARRTSLGILVALLLLIPFLPVIGSIYQISILISALIYVMLALGLNIIVGLAGQLVLGYAAFYAIGAYTYALLTTYFGFGFWICLPIGGVMTILFGLALGFPVLRLRGDYLAIVTLGFGEIVRLMLLNWVSVTGGSHGISNIPKPGLFGIELDIQQATVYLYYLCVAAVIVAIIIITRLKNSRVGLALQALREDEIASEAMGINLTRVKLSAFALSSAWAGFAGVFFAAKTSFVNPASFTFMESAMMLSMVVLGGMGSITGVTLGALILILVPEYLRAFADYRMLLFGLVMVLMMIFRPQGLITGERRKYRISALEGKEGAA